MVEETPPMSLALTHETVLAKIPQTKLFCDSRSAPKQILRLGLNLGVFCQTWSLGTLHSPAAGPCAICIPW